MKIERNKNLKDYNQYGVEAKAKYFVEISTKKEIVDVLKSEYSKDNLLILGDGNNILFTKDFDGLIIKPNLKGRKIVEENDDFVLVEMASGENWDEFVKWAVKNSYQGIENMILIPSSIGGAVSQNIAAYGQNIMDVVTKVYAIEIETGEEKEFEHKDCEFKYRESIFKKKFKNKYIITSAVFKLNKVVKELETSYHERKSRYGSLEDELKSFAKEPYTIHNVMTAVINQRNKKLPSVSEYGTCGSVFANPTISKEKYLELSKIISELQSYPVDKLQYTIKEWDKINDNYVKIPAGRIIDELGWRGKWERNVGVYDKHALCIVTNRKANGKDIYEFLENIRNDVKKHYDIDLEYEINII
ncbi:UDP-N-acetylenolpyruvoylglucosamine reductase [Candidatus Dojkabacteria bacterium HGW-Dojkabacteria-1]|uniref:UDP-N-acetylenolpyruvoylglucosamine reductase n=1 Tax=Candidatus Dojkabacteria bacterium HGW-Dojkabacteria-1 TaxID=2013761 RepID=A0A2N2F424_9BACT|nr:MAG: UDP-N-acetylenolpyruvoylglucosamine reductase [Candidatus Dojkabacteria bacterium HGW-Dojkabacteria-1]